MRNIQYLTIDLNKKTQQDVTANEGEIGSRFLKIKITDNNVPIDLTGTKVYLYALKSDNTKLFNLVEIENATQGIVLAELTSQLLTSAGVVKLTLVITEETKKLISKEFTLKVDDSIFDDDAIASTNEFTALTNALGQVQNIDNRFNEVDEQFISINNLKNEYEKYFIVLKDEIECLKYKVSESDSISDTYRSFEELKLHETLNVDYRIRYDNLTNNKVCVMTPHGGSIEPGTSEIIEEVSRDTYNYYIFEGIKSSNNSTLHITSTNFNEPDGVYTVRTSENTMAIHGASGDTLETYIGGLDTDLIQKVTTELTKAGFTISESPSNISGTKMNNIVNRNKKRSGVQLELTTALRKSFFENNDFSSSNRKNKTQEFYKYCNALKSALSMI